MKHNNIIEGAVTGSLGATVVAAWFFAVDVIAGQPLFTPNALGSALLGSADGGTVSLSTVLIYTLFHYAAFAVVGIIAAASTHLAESQPLVLAFFTVLFFAFEAAFYGLVAVLDAFAILGSITWYQVGIGNALAVAAMGSFLWVRHPRIRGNLDVALRGPV